MPLVATSVSQYFSPPTFPYSSISTQQAAIRHRHLAISSFQSVPLITQQYPASTQYPASNQLHIIHCHQSKSDAMRISYHRSHYGHSRPIRCRQAQSSTQPTYQSPTHQRTSTFPAQPSIRSNYHRSPAAPATPVPPFTAISYHAFLNQSGIASTSNQQSAISAAPPITAPASTSNTSNFPNQSRSVYRSVENDTI